MDFKTKLPFLALLIVSTCAQPQTQPQFRQNNQEPQFSPPSQDVPISGQFGSFQEPAAGQQRQNQFPQSAQQQQQQQQQFFPQSAQQPTQQQSFQQPSRPAAAQPQPNFNDFAAFNSRQQAQDNLPTLPPVFIPPNSPQGPPPQLQSPIRNLFRQPENNFSLSNLISRFLNIFNLNSN